MSIWTLLGHRLRAFGRSSFLGRRLLSAVIGGVVALYFAGGLALLGIVFDDLVREAAPGADPLLVASRWLGPLGLGYAGLRVFAESGIGADPRPYQALPVRRSALVTVLMGLVLASAWNAVPLAFVGAVVVEAVLSGPPGAALRFGGAALAVLAAVTYAVPMIREGLSARPFAAVGVVALVAGATGIEVVDVGAGWASLPVLSGWLFGGVVRGAVGPTVAVVVGVAALAGGYARWLRRAMRIDRAGAASATRASGDGLGALARRGPVLREAVLALRLVLRNARTRLTLFLALLLPGIIAVLGPFVDDMEGLRELLTGTQLFNTAMWQGLLGTGAFVFLHGVNYFSWEGEHVEGAMARPVRPRHRMEGKVALLAASVFVCFLIPLPFLVGWTSPFLAVHTSFFLYNLGVLVPVMTAGATFNRTALTPNEHALLGEVNFSGGRTALILPVMGLPIGLLYGVADPLVGLAAVGGVGLASILSYPLWRRGLAGLYRRNRHAMARGFRETDA